MHIEIFEIVMKFCIIPLNDCYINIGVLQMIFRKMCAMLY